MKLPSPTSASLPAKHVISIESGRFAQYFGFESEADADLVVLSFIEILRNAFDGRNKS